PLFQTVTIKRELNHSFLYQEIMLKRSSRLLKFRTKVDWKEKHKLLKVEFPATLYTDEALHEIQFGYVKRPTHRSRPHDADRFEVCQHKWSALVEGERTFAILNDC